MIKHMRKQSRENHRKSALKKPIPEDRNVGDLVVSMVSLCEGYSFSESLTALTDALDAVYVNGCVTPHECDKDHQERLYGGFVGCIVRQLRRKFLERINK